MEHERAVIAKWRESGGDQEMADRLTRFAADIDLYSPEDREDASALMFGRPGAPEPRGILYNSTLRR